MAEINQFGSAKPVRSGEGTSCAQCEAMLADWMDDSIDGVLSAKDRAAFELHIATCAECSQMLADAQRGAALLEMLKSPRPEPSALLLERIIAQTSGLNTDAAAPIKSNASGALTLPVLDGGSVEIHSVVPASPALNSVAVPAAYVAAGNVIPFRGSSARRFNMKAITHTLMQPRLAMTAAMAFFSIALTLNLTGIHLNELRASDLKPSSLKRSFYQANASVVRYYDNLRVVYELESRVRDLQRANENENPPASGDAGAKDNSNSDSNDKSQQKHDQPQKQTPKAGSGTSQRRSPLNQQLRLADYGPRSLDQQDNIANRQNAVATVDRREFELHAYKSKEAMQEGVRV